MGTPLLEPGELVRIRAGVADPDLPGLELGGLEVLVDDDPDDEGFVSLTFTPDAMVELERRRPGYRGVCEAAGLWGGCVILRAELLEVPAAAPAASAQAAAMVAP